MKFVSTHLFLCALLAVVQSADCLAQTPSIGESIIILDSKVPVRLSSQTSQSPYKLSSVVDEASVELIRDRYSDGKLKVERQVAMNERGDFVNHGLYRGYSPKGDLLVEGEYTWGQRSGAWMKRLDGAELTHLQSISTGFKPPLMSTTEFVDGKMSIMWVLTDQANRTLAQIELRDGLRHGLSVVYSPTGEVRQQANYQHGVLQGNFAERQDSKSAKEETFVNGRKVIKDVQKSHGGSTKSEYQYLSPVHKIGVADDWDASTLGKLVADGEQTLHGPFATYHANGTAATKGTYRNGLLQGSYEAWHINGEAAVVGQYEAGKQIGEWTWRHPNGMKQAIAKYVDGAPSGKILAWDDSGKAVTKPVGTDERTADQKQKAVR